MSSIAFWRLRTSQSWHAIAIVSTAAPIAVAAWPLSAHGLPGPRQPSVVRITGAGTAPSSSAADAIAANTRGAPVRTIASRSAHTVAKPSTNTPRPPAVSSAATASLGTDTMTNALSSQVAQHPTSWKGS